MIKHTHTDDGWQIQGKTNMQRQSNFNIYKPVNWILSKDILSFAVLMINRSASARALYGNTCVCFVSFITSPYASYMCWETQVFGHVSVVQDHRLIHSSHLLAFALLLTSMPSMRLIASGLVPDVWNTRFKQVWLLCSLTSLSPSWRHNWPFFVFDQMGTPFPKNGLL